MLVTYATPKEHTLTAMGKGVYLTVKIKYNMLNNVIRYVEL